MLRLLGSFRLHDLFEVGNIITTLTEEEYRINGEKVALFRPNTSYEVKGLKAIPSEPIRLIDGIAEKELLRLSMIRLSIDQLAQEFTIYSGEKIYITRLIRDNVLTYNLFCFPSNHTLGYNSVAVKVKY